MTLEFVLVFVLAAVAGTLTVDRRRSLLWYAAVVVATYGPASGFSVVIADALGASAAGVVSR